MLLFTDFVVFLSDVSLPLQTSSLVASEILRRQSPSARATVIEKWATVGEVCRNLHNFNSVLEISSAFMSSSIFRLKKTWEKVSKQVSTAHVQSTTYSCVTQFYSSVKFCVCNSKLIDLVNGSFSFLCVSLRCFPFPQPINELLFHRERQRIVPEFSTIVFRFKSIVTFFSLRLP